MRGEPELCHGVFRASVHSLLEQGLHSRVHCALGFVGSMLFVVLTLEGGGTADLWRFGVDSVAVSRLATGKTGG